MYCLARLEVPLVGAEMRAVSGLRELRRAGGDERGGGHERHQRAIIHPLPLVRDSDESALRGVGLKAEPPPGELLPELEGAVPHRARMNVIDRPEHTARIAQFS